MVVHRRKLVPNSGWDQFCDFTSLVGFRLLHSNQPLWIRCVTAALMCACSVLICMQCLHFWTKFQHSVGQRVATVTHTESQPLRQPRFLVCVTRQAASLLRGHGSSVDFRQLVYNYQMEEKLPEEFIKKFQTEMAEVEDFLKGVQSNSSEQIYNVGMQVARNLSVLREIKAALWFDYATNFTVSPMPESIRGILKGTFFPNDKTGVWEPSWQVDSGLCALGGPSKRPFVIISGDQQRAFDYILIRTNRLEAHPNSRIKVHLVHEKHGSEGRELIRANTFELVAGKHLEVTLRGMSEILDENCHNQYEPGCVPPNFPYSPEPDLFLSEFVGDYGHNCTLLEAIRCGPIQRELYHKTDCPIACVSIEFTTDTAVSELTLEKLNMPIGNVQHQAMAEQLQLVDSINRHKFPHRWTKGGPWAKDGVQAKIWKATAQLSRLLDDYYIVMISVYRLLYGSSFTFPALFAEDIVGILDQIPGPEFAPLSHFTKMDLAKLEFCGQPANGHLAKKLKNLGKIYLDHFRNSSFRVTLTVGGQIIWEWYPQYPCTVSISNTSCRKLLNQSENTSDLAAIQELIASSSYRQSTIELALTLNSTPPNPIPILQFYGQSNNLRHLNESFNLINYFSPIFLTMRRLARSADQLQKLLAKMIENGTENRYCLEAKFEVLNQMLNSSNLAVLAKPVKGRWNNDWFDQFSKFLAQYNGARLLPDYLTSNMALFTIHYRGRTHQNIVYRDDYTVWELMSDVGGVLGLYFGLTIITVYELIVFATMVDQKEARRMMEEQ